MDLPRPPRWKRLLKHCGIAALVVAVGLVLPALLLGRHLQQRSDAAVRSQQPAPEKFVVVDHHGGPPGNGTHHEHRIHYRLEGAGEVTFVLEAGLGDYSGNWGPLEAKLAKLGRVFVYDRAGLGWSEPCHLSPGSARAGNELGPILKAAKIPPPYILVGHSLGALALYVYSRDGGSDVAGMLLIDPSHPGQFKRVPPPPAFVRWLLPLASRLAPTGLPQLLMRSEDPMQNTTWHVQATAAEFQGTLDWMDTRYTPPLRLGPLPLTVLTAGDNLALGGRGEAERQAAQATWNALHEEWLAASTSDLRQHRVIAGAGHYLHRTHSDAVAEAARDLLARINPAAPKPGRQRQRRNPRGNPKTQT